MEPSAPIKFPRATIDPLEFDLHEIEAAIEMVAQGAATSVSIVGLRRPEAVAGSGVALAQRANVAFSLERDGDGRPTVSVTRVSDPSQSAGDASR